MAQKQDSSNDRIKILAIDDHPLFSKGIALLLESLQKDYAFESAVNMEEATFLIEVFKPNLILIDLTLNLKHWSDNIALIQKLCGNQVAIAVISSSEDRRTIQNVMATGIQGFLPKSATPDILIAAISLILAGGTFVPTQLQARTLAENHKAASIQHCLSKRQKEILQYAISGKTNKVIAYELNLSESTIKSHIASAYKALNVKNRIQAMQVCEDLNLFDKNLHEPTQK